MTESVQTPPAAVLSDGEAIAAQIVATRTFTMYMAASMLLALVEKGALDPERVFAFGQMNAAILRQTAATTTGGKVAVQGCSMAADMLDEFEAMIRNMARKPDGAGTA
jgi:hypothetical protein